MRGLPADIDLSFLRDVALIQVCVGAHEAILNFDEPISITVETPFRITAEHGSTLYDDPRDGASALAKIIPATTAAVIPETNGTLTLVFTSGVELKLYDSNEGYESYQIHNGPTTIVV
jgi:hypothetical protein